MKKLTILVDMDDTIENLTEAWVHYTNERYGTHTVKSDVRNWDVSSAFPTLTHDQVYDLLLEEELYRTSVPLDGAYEYLQRLIADGHEIYIVTCTQYEIMKVKMEELLFKFFPFLHWDHVIITARKQMIRGDVLVDDGPHNLVGGDYEKILMSASHNEDFDAEANGVRRVYNWKEAYARICEIAEND